MTQQLELPRPTLPDCAPGIVSLDPPTLQCHDCGATYTDEKARGRIGWTVIFSAGQGWGFLYHCEHPKVRRCGDCNQTHRDTQRGARMTPCCARCKNPYTGCGARQCGCHSTPTTSARKKKGDAA